MSWCLARRSLLTKVVKPLLSLLCFSSVEIFVHQLFMCYCLSHVTRWTSIA
jgi:hypothetical protein